MRELTYKGFLKTYVHDLSLGKTNNIYRLAGEIAAGNLRLKEPLFLYAYNCGKMEELLAAVRNTKLETEYRKILGGEEYPERYSRVYKSFCTERDKHLREDEVKALMRTKILRLKEEKKISNYRIYTDLQLNAGNVNSWLKTGTANKISLKTARAIMAYAEQV